MVPVKQDTSPYPSSRLLAVKVGGGLLAFPGMLDRVGEALARTATRRPLVVIPGGGPFADQVREFESQHGLSSSAAHWMAILGMDQYAEAIADHTPAGLVIRELAGVREAHAAGAVPVLAPHRWLRAADELPHSWDVTSDSLAAYLATLMGAEELVLIKPVSGGAELADPHFSRALGARMRWRVVSATGPLDEALG